MEIEMLIYHEQRNTKWSEQMFHSERYEGLQIGGWNNRRFSDTKLKYSWSITRYVRHRIT